MREKYIASIILRNISLKSTNIKHKKIFLVKKVLLEKKMCYVTSD